MKYPINSYEKFKIPNKGEVIIVDTIKNKCADIKTGDEVEVEGISYSVKELEWFMKSFGIKGDTVSLLITP